MDNQKNNPLEESFPVVNEGVCLYCQQLVMAWSGEDSRFGCKIRKEEGKYVSLEESAKQPNYHSGCGTFKQSGIQTHPTLVEILIKRNPLARNIPVSEQAIESGIDFEQKVYSNLPSEQRVQWAEIR